MNYILSVSFEDFSFRNEMVGFILENVKIKSLEYYKDFEWFKSNKRDIFEIDCSQIQFNLSNGGQLVLQDLGNSLPRLYGGKIIFETIQIIRKNVEELFFKLIHIGFANDYLDYILQNEEDVEYFKQKNGYIPPYVQILPNPNYVEGAPGMDIIPKEFISIESLPGHFHQMGYGEKLWFGSCWQMYFSPIYYKYIPKPLWDDFTDCYEHKVFENGLRRITLFENIEDFDSPESRALQWAFRRQLGIDSIAHELTKSNNRVEPENLPVIISKQNCEVGQTRVTRFLDEQNYLTSSRLASKKEIKEYLDDGITVVFEITEAVS